TQELLDGADVVAGFKEVGREGVAERMGRDVFGNSGGDGGAPDLFLNHRLVKVVATGLTGGDVEVGSSRGECPLPCPLAGRRGVLATQRLGQFHETAASFDVRRVLSAYDLEMLA